MKSFDKENAAFMERLMEHQADLFGFVAAMLPYFPDDIDDVAQETNVALIRNASAYDPARPFRPWLLSAARNKVKDFLRRKKSAKVIFDGATVDRAAALMAADEPSEPESPLLHRLAECKRKLGDSQRELLALRYNTDLSLEEIGRKTGLNERAVRNALYYIRKRLAECVRAMCPTAEEEPAEEFIDVEGEFRNFPKTDANLREWLDQMLMHVALSRRFAASKPQKTHRNWKPLAAAASFALCMGALAAVQMSTRKTSVPAKTQSIETKTGVDMNAKTAAVVVASAAIATPNLSIAAKAITDTTGYVTLTKSDGNGNSTSLNSAGNWSDKAAPSSGKDYLVNNKLIIRSSWAANAKITFGGRSLTLDDEANFILKGVNSETTINDLRIYNAYISQGDGKTTKHLYGNMTIFGTADAPSIIQGSGNGNFRVTFLRGNIIGEEDAVLKIRRTPGEADSADGDFAGEFYCILRGNNTNYKGSILVEGEHINAVLSQASTNPMGANPDITLKNGGGLLTDHWLLKNCSITLDGGGKIGSYMVAEGTESFCLGATTTISGTGTLLIENPNGPYATAQNYMGHITFGGVDITGIDGIHLRKANMRINADYDNPAIPISSTANGVITVLTENKLGALALSGTSRLAMVNAQVSTPSLTLSDSADLELKLVKDKPRLCVDRSITKGDGNIVIHLANLLVGELVGTNCYPVLTAENLGTELTASDFTIDTANCAPFLQQTLSGGTFSIETQNGTNFLMYTLATRPVMLATTDAPGKTSWNLATQWNPQISPTSTEGASCDFFIPGGKTLRARGSDAPSTQATFAGHSISVTEGGDLSIMNQEAIINDLRLYTGGKSLFRRTSGGKISGNAICYASVSQPFCFVGEVSTSGTSTENNRVAEFASTLTGSGDIAFLYQASDVNHTAQDGHPAILKVTGNNSAFTGGWQMRHFCTELDFSSAAALGSSESAFRSDRLTFINGGVLSLSESLTVPQNFGLRVDTGLTGITNGAVVRVAAGKSATIAGKIYGNGLFRKKGSGTLTLTAENALSNKVVVCEGTLAVNNPLALGGVPVRCEDGGTLRIECENGVTIKGTSPIADDGSLVVSVPQFDGTRPTATNVTLLSLPDCETFDLSQVRVSKGGLSGYIVEPKLRNRDGGGLEVYAYAHQSGTVIMLLTGD